MKQTFKLVANLFRLNKMFTFDYLFVCVCVCALHIWDHLCDKNTLHAIRQYFLLKLVQKLFSHTHTHTKVTSITYVYCIIVVVISIVETFIVYEFIIQLSLEIRLPIAHSRHEIQFSICMMFKVSTCIHILNCCCFCYCFMHACMRVCCIYQFEAEKIWCMVMLSQLRFQVFFFLSFTWVNHHYFMSLVCSFHFRHWFLYKYSTEEEKDKLKIKFVHSSVSLNIQYQIVWSSKQTNVNVCFDFEEI